MSKTCTPPTRPPTGLESSVLKPSTARSKTSRPTKSTAHDWIIKSRDRTQPGMIIQVCLPTPRPYFLPSSVTAQLFCRIACQVSWKLLHGLFCEPERVILPKTHLRPHS